LAATAASWAPEGGLFSYHLLAGLNGTADVDRDGARGQLQPLPQAPGLTEEASEAVLTRLPPRRDRRPAPSRCGIIGVDATRPSLLLRR